MSKLERLEKVSKPTGRRKLLAGAVVGAVAALTRVGEKTVEAAPLTGTSSDAGTPAMKAINSADGLALGAVSGQAFVPLFGVAPAFYARHSFSGRTAIIGDATGAGSVGVRGEAVTGVWGQGLLGDGTGVLGTGKVAGVRGEIPSLSFKNGSAVIGVNQGSYAGANPGEGGWGVYGASTKGHGVVGVTTTGGGTGILGASGGLADASAGIFFGRVIVTGDFFVYGAKSAAVPHPDGSHRQVYCVESPESWFEDFGTGELVNGRAEIAIEAGFAAISEMSNYHVFLTGYDHDHLLHVTRRTAEGFTVEANSALARLQGRTTSELSGSFSWRLVAKRKDIAGERLAKVTKPREPEFPSIDDCAPTPAEDATHDGATR